jgi:probable F420-dependent oxidoreductase
MKFGVVAFTSDRGLGICDLARQVETAGLGSLFLVQNTHVPVTGASLLDEDGHAADHHFLDPFVALGAAAAVTTRIKLDTGICTALIYDPIILAMQVSTLDHLSAGRFLFGIGVGHEDTVHNHGISPELRHRLLREKVQAMKAIWADDNAEFHGEFVNFDPILTGLRPYQQPHPPILIGGQSRGSLTRTVEYGDGWFPVLYEELDIGAQMLELERRCQVVGKPGAPVTAALWEIDERLMEKCAELGVDRCVVAYHAEDKGGLPALLERYRPLVERFGGSVTGEQP